MRHQNRKSLSLFLFGILAVGFLVASQAQALGKKTQKLQAYRGAPPTIPHDVQELGRKKCLSCHFQGLDLGLKGGKAYKTPHPERSNCLQCHLPQKKVDLFQENRFVPLPPKEQPAPEKK